MMSDMCELPPGSEIGRGRLGPGEVREYPFGQEVKDGKPPAVKLEFVLFEDLSLDGLIRDAEASPANFTATIQRRAALLESQRQHLLRHLPRS
jgi:hypothetical protein